MKFDINKENIDIVYFYRDNSDEFLTDNKKKLFQEQSFSFSDAKFKDVRTQTNEELKYSLRSVEKFVPWINKIFIITDTKLPDWLNINNPKLHIIDLKELIGEESYPSFNECIIPFHLHKIDTLSEHFIYGYDYMFFGRKVSKTDFYTKSGDLIERVCKLSNNAEQIINKNDTFSKIELNSKKIIFNSKVTMYEKFGFIYNFYSVDNFIPLKKSLLKECCAEFEEVINIANSQRVPVADKCIDVNLFYAYAKLKNKLITKRMDSFYVQTQILNKPRFNFSRFFKKIDCITLHLGQVYSPHSPVCVLQEKPLLFALKDVCSTRDRHRVLLSSVLKKYFPKSSSFEKSEQINICLACDDNYVLHCATVIKSILKNSKSRFINFYILSRGLNNSNVKALEKVANTKCSTISFKNVSIDDFQDCPLLESSHFSIETYFRLKISTLFPAVDKMLYIDCDIVVLSDIVNLWALDITDSYVGASVDVSDIFHLEHYLGKNKYFNAGVLLINSKKWRADNIEKKCFDFIRNNKKDIIWQDQDTLNCVLCGKVKYFDMSWNFEYNPTFDKVSDLYKEKQLNLIHYISKNKPWNSIVPAKYTHYYYKYAIQTPFKIQTVKNYINAVIFPRIPFLKQFLFDREIINMLAKEVAGKRVVLWGASLYLEKLIKKYKMDLPQIIGIIDRDTSKINKNIGKYKIYSPASLKELQPDKIISSVVNNKRMSEFIKQELDKQNIDIPINVKIFSSGE